MAALAITMRPRQWPKNLLVIAAAGAAGALGRDDVPVRVGLAFVAFCLLASGIYAVNDAHDAAEDRLHPRKCRRPVAAGEITAREATALGGGLALAGIALCGAIRPLLGTVALGYVTLTLSYTYLWRRIPVLDLVAIAGGFVLRAVAGGVAAEVALSRWFVLVISFVAVLVAAGKRDAERRRTDSAGARRRSVLNHYSAGRLRAALVLAALGAIVAYGAWASQLPSVDGVPWRLLTLAPFVFCLVRYGRLVQAGRAEAPDELVLQDRPLLLAASIWLALFALGVHAAA